MKTPRSRSYQPSKIAEARAAILTWRAGTLVGIVTEGAHSFRHESREIGHKRRRKDGSVEGTRGDAPQLHQYDVRPKSDDDDEYLGVASVHCVRYRVLGVDVRISVGE